MPVVRIVLFKTKPGATEEQKQAFVDESRKTGRGAPGVISLELGPALDMDRTKGYDMGIVLVVENKEALGAWASDPAHLRLHELREEMSEDSLAFNLAC